MYYGDVTRIVLEEQSGKTCTFCRDRGQTCPSVWVFYSPPLLNSRKEARKKAKAKSVVVLLLLTVTIPSSTLSSMLAGL